MSTTLPMWSAVSHTHRRESDTSITMNHTAGFIRHRRPPATLNPTTELILRHQPSTTMNRTASRILRHQSSTTLNRTASLIPRHQPFTTSLTLRLPTRNRITAPPGSVIGQPFVFSAGPKLITRSQSAMERSFWPVQIPPIHTKYIRSIPISLTPIIQYDLILSLLI